LVFPELPITIFPRTIETYPTFLPGHVETQEIWSLLRDISAEIETPEMVVESRSSLSSRIYLAEYRISSLRSDLLGGLAQHINMFSILFEGFRLATHLYLHLAIREIPARAKMHRGMILRLRDVLQVLFMFDETEDLTTYLPLILWISFLGAAAANSAWSHDDASLKPHFVDGLRLACRRLEIWERAQFEKMLKEVLWVDRFCNAACSTLWETISIT
jgi:hypothetical protein